MSVVHSVRAVLDDAYGRVAAKYGDIDPIPTPPFWGGFRLQPATVEFWQGRADRLHDRVRYRFADATWVVERLAP